MTTLTVTLNNEHALRLLEDLELLGALTIQDRQQDAPQQPIERTFKAFSFPTKGFKFNRDEANEREGLL